LLAALQMKDEGEGEQADGDRRAEDPQIAPAEAAERARRFGTPKRSRDQQDMRSDRQGERQYGDADPAGRSPITIGCAPPLAGYAALFTPQGALPKDSTLNRESRLRRGFLSRLG